MDLPIIQLEGTPRAMGEAFGERCRDDIRRLYEIRMQSARVFAREAGRRTTVGQVLEICGRCMKITEAFDPIGHEEMCGVGRGEPQGATDGLLSGHRRGDQRRQGPADG